MSGQLYTKEEAMEIVDDFSDLVDTTFRKDGVSWQITGIRIQPVQTNLAFSEEASDETQVAGGLKEAKKYDVLVDASDVLYPDLGCHVDIRSFALMTGITYRFPV